MPTPVPSGQSRSRADPSPVQPSRLIDDADTETDALVVFDDVFDVFDAVFVVFDAFDAFDAVVFPVCTMLVTAELWAFAGRPGGALELTPIGVGAASPRVKRCTSMRSELWSTSALHTIATPGCWNVAITSWPRSRTRRTVQPGAALAVTTIVLRSSQCVVTVPAPFTE